MKVQQEKQQTAWAEHIHIKNISALAEKYILFIAQRDKWVVNPVATLLSVACFLHFQIIFYLPRSTSHQTNSF